MDLDEKLQSQTIESEKEKTLKKDLKAAQERITTLRNSMVALKKSNVDLKEELVGASERIDQLENQLKRSQSVIKLITNKLTEAIANP